MDTLTTDQACTVRYAKKRDAILAAAARTINRAGVKGMTLADVAASVGLITTSVTYYFKRKEDLASACFLDAIARLGALVDQALTESTAEKRVSSFVGLCIDLDLRIRLGEAPPIAMFGDTRALGEPYRSTVGAAYLELFRKARGFFDAPGLEWMTRKAATARTLMLVEQVLWAATWLPRYEAEDYPRVRERMLDILRNGIAAPGREWAPVPLDPPAVNDAQARDAFLLAATRLINRHGYRGASVEQISAALNVTKGSFYHHIDAKDDLVAACFERSFALVRQAQTAAMRLEADSWVRLASAAANLVEKQLSADGPLLRSTAFSALPEPIRARMLDEQGRLSDRFAGMISDGVAEGALRPVDAAIAAQMLNATLNAASDLRTSVSQVIKAEIAELYAKPMLMGVFSR